MIRELIFVNPITESEEMYNIDITFNNKEEWLEEANKNDVLAIKDYINVIDRNKNILVDSFGYNYYMGLIMFHLDRIKNVYEYNRYIDIINKLHSTNINFNISYNVDIPREQKGKRKARNKVKAKNEYVRYVSKDIFTNANVYTYTNHYTGDEFNSDNGELLDTLNTPTKKVKTKKHIVDFGNITFNFKKKC